MTPQCLKIRKNILKVSLHSGHGHIPTCFSIVEILCAVYRHMRHNPADPSLEGRDVFILSKGHGALAQYCTLAEFGYFDIDEVYSFGAFMSGFGCHADRFKTPGVEVSTGSLGHGIGLAVGTALAFRLKNNGRRVYVVIGDGEANEGSVWEAVMVAVNLRLDNLTIIYDNNRSHSRGLQIPNPAERFKSFNCDAAEVDGHDVGNIMEALSENGNGVKAIIADTRKGFGCNTMIENQYAWHRRSPTNEEFKMMMEELDAQAV